MTDRIESAIIWNRIRHREQSNSFPIFFRLRILLGRVHCRFAGKNRSGEKPTLAGCCSKAWGHILESFFDIVLVWVNQSHHVDSCFWISLVVFSVELVVVHRNDSSNRGVATKYLNNYLVWNNFVNYARESYKEKEQILTDFVFTTETKVLCKNVPVRNPVPIRKSLLKTWGFLDFTG